MAPFTPPHKHTHTHTTRDTALMENFAVVVGNGSGVVHEYNFMVH